MSDTFDEDMYRLGDDSPVPAAPQLISQNRVGISSVGNMRKLNVDGEELLVVDPKQVQTLEQRLRSAEARVNEIQGMYLKSQTQIKRLSGQLDELTRRLNGITNFNE